MSEKKVVREERKHKLTYKIVGRRTITADAFDLEYVDVIWTHECGEIPSTVLIPVTHPNIHPAMGDRDTPIEYKEVVWHARKDIPDCITVKAGTPDSIVMQILEEKRQRLADNLGLEP